MKNILTIILTFIFFQYGFSIENEPDYLILNSDTIEIWNFPLESYFTNSIRPDCLYLTKKDKEYRRKSYSATWELKNDSLILCNISLENKTIYLTKIFKNEIFKSQIFAWWFNGSITIFSGNQITFLRKEYEQIFNFSKGIKSQEIINHYTIFNSSEYSEDVKKLKDFISNNIDYSKLDDPYEYARVYVRIISVTEEGKIDSVNIAKGWDMTKDNEAMRIIKSIPKWTVIHKNGEHFNEIWVIPVKFGQ